MRTISVTTEKGSSILIPAHPVDEVGANERADFFTKRSLKKESKLSALYLALSMCDLTTLEGSDTPGKVLQMCANARHPVPPDLIESFLKKKSLGPIPSVAAVCVYPSMVPVAVKAFAQWALKQIKESKQKGESLSLKDIVASSRLVDAEAPKRTKPPKSIESTEGSALINDNQVEKLNGDKPAKP